MPAKIKPPSRADLVALVNQHMGHLDIADHYGVSQTTVGNWLRLHRLGTNSTRGAKRRDLPVEEIRQLVAGGMLRPALCRRYRCSDETMRRVLAENGIKTVRQMAIDANRAMDEEMRQAVIRSAPSAKAFQFSDPFNRRAHA